MRLPFDLERPLVFFDLETTGLSIEEDRIIELAIIRLSPQGDVLERVRLPRQTSSTPSKKKPRSSSTAQMTRVMARNRGI